MFDTHLHLDDEAFDLDRDDVVARALAAGVGGLLTVGTGLESSRAAVMLAGRLPQVWAAVGIHPHAAPEAIAETMATLGDLAASPGVVAIGESGLDYARDYAPREAQHDAFRRHIRLSLDLDLPLVVHNREAHGDVLEILAREGARRVIMHCFSGSPDMARLCVARGYYVSLAGPVTYRNARRLLEVATAVSLDRLLLETDAPYLPPEPFRGRRNEPAHLVHTARRVADVRGITLEELAAATTASARAALGLGRP
ncbi:MAG: TatD family hydrolase [Armatimonadetes bacterium]|nr:TatD family hydrolase [Armatimonadota bacterium]